MIWSGIAVALGYLLGSVSAGLLLGRLAGVDLRAHGSGNVGATNAVRARGARFGVAVFALDAAKGAIAVALLPLLAPPAAWIPAACGAAAIVGHVFPLWFRFRGGKGFATALGVIAVLAPVALAPVAGAWVLVLLLTGYVSAATLSAAVAFPAFVAAVHGAGRPALLAFAAALAAFLFFTHRSNVRRLARGDEHRFRRVWVLGRVRG